MKFVTSILIYKILIDQEAHPCYNFMSQPACAPATNTSMLFFRVKISPGHWPEHCPPPCLIWKSCFNWVNFWHSYNLTWLEMYVHESNCSGKQARPCDLTLNLFSSIVGSTEASSKVFLLFFLCSDWLKSDHIRSRIEHVFLDIFRAIV